MRIIENYGALAVLCLIAACSSAQPNQADSSRFIVPTKAGAGAAATSAGQAGSASSSANVTTGEGQGCTQIGAKRSCCGGAGTQICAGTAEFKAWGACLDGKGNAATCDIPQHTACGQGEFAASCVDSGIPHHCGEGEFGPSCEKPKLCTERQINNEPEILAAYSPSLGQTVGMHGQIKVWINDERPALIASGEQIDASNGKITAPGDRTGQAPDGYLWEPALYIAPDTAENGGKPHFPQSILGWYNNMPPFVRGPASGTEVSGMEPPPPGTKMPERYSTELVWDVAALELGPGEYVGEFVIHDGDRDRAVGCVTIEITN